MVRGFIKNEEFLRESHEVEDRLGISNEINQFKKRLRTIRKPSVLGLVGPFGSGKSTMLYQIQKQSEKSERWVNFEAWKYPDRKDLWEGFVLDFVKEVSPQEFKRVDKKVKGKQNDDRQILIKTLSRIPGFAALESLNHFFETSPARRVDEIQNILQEQIKRVDQDLFIIIEDIDRSGDSGVFFLETLKQFLSNLKTDKKFVVIVPISDRSYHDKLDSYLKSVDYFEFFQIQEIKLDKFIDEIFDESLFTMNYFNDRTGQLIWTGTKRRSQTVSFLEGVFKKHDEISMRLIKLIIRKANLVYINQVNDGHEPDFRVSLCVEASKYISTENGSNDKYFDEFKRLNCILQNNIFASFLNIIMNDGDSIFQTEYNEENPRGRQIIVESKNDFFFVNRINNDTELYPSYPYRDAERRCYIPNFYLS